MTAWFCKKNLVGVTVLILVLAVKGQLNSSEGQSGQPLTCPNVTKTDDCERKLDKVLRISVLLPSESTDTDPHNLVYHNRLEWVQAGIEVAGGNGGYASPLAEILPEWKVEVMTGNTVCSSTHGPLEAFRMHCDAGKTISTHYF